MKKLLFGTVVSAMAILNTSCLDNGDYNEYLPELYTYATVSKSSENATSEQDSLSTDIYFTMDNNQTFAISENKSSIDYKKLSVGRRVITGVTLKSSYEETFDYTATLFEVVDVVSGKNRVVVTQSESDAIRNDYLSFIATTATLTNGYLNIYAGFSAMSQEIVDFYLVENLTGEITPGGANSDYLNLELRFSRATNGSVNFEKYISFDMESFREKLEGKKGINLSVKTLKSGDFDMKINSTSLFPAE